MLLEANPNTIPILLVGLIIQLVFVGLVGGVALTVLRAIIRFLKS